MLLPVLEGSQANCIEPPPPYPPYPILLLLLLAGFPPTGMGPCELGMLTINLPRISYIAFLSPNFSFNWRTLSQMAEQQGLSDLMAKF